MSSIALSVLDLTVVEPENFVCLVLQPQGQNKVVPVWVAGPEAIVAMAYLNDVSDGRRRAIDSLIELLEQVGGVDAIEIVSYHEGKFVFDVTAGSGIAVEVAATDAAIIAQNFGVDIQIEPELLAQVAVFASPEDLDEYLGVAYVTPAQGGGVADESAVTQIDSASGDPQADADFLAMMRDLGVDENDFHADDEKE